MQDSSEKDLIETIDTCVHNFKSGFYGINMQKRVAGELLEAHPDKAKEIIAVLLAVIARDARTMLSLSCPFHKTQPEKCF